MNAARMSNLVGFSRKAGRTLNALALSPVVPRWAKVGILVALLPIPGPVDEIVGAVVVWALLRGVHRATVLAVWEES